MRADNQATSKEPLGRFVGRAGLLLAIIAAAAAAWLLRNVLLILFGALVLAVGMNALAKFLSSRMQIGLESMNGGEGNSSLVLGSDCPGSDRHTAPS
jgi:hypothetical protein